LQANVDAHDPEPKIVPRVVGNARRWRADPPESAIEGARCPAPGAITGDNCAREIYMR
jgi:hypothetical protein